MEINEKTSLLAHYLKHKYFKQDSSIRKQDIESWIVVTNTNIESVYFNTDFKTRENLKKAIISKRKSPKITKPIPIYEIPEYKINKKMLHHVSKLIDTETKNAHKWVKRIFRHIDNLNYINLESIMDHLFLPKKLLIRRDYLYYYFRSHAVTSTGLILDNSDKKEWEKITGETLTHIKGETTLKNVKSE